MKKARQWMFTIVASAGLLAGCAVGPDYKRPTTTPPEAFRGQTGPGKPRPSPTCPGGRSSGIDAPGAAADRAGQQLRPARGRRPRGGGAGLGGQGQGRSFPRSGMKAISRGARFSRVFGVPLATRPRRRAPSGPLHRPLDIWGRIRRQYEAARAQFFGTEEATAGGVAEPGQQRRAGLLRVVELDAQLDIAKRNTASFQGTFNLFQRRLEFGLASTLETSRAEGALGSAAGPSRTSSGRSRPRRTRSVSCWGGIPARSRGARPCSSRPWCRRSRRGCRPRSSSGARTCGRRSSSWCRPTPRSAWPWPTSSRRSS